MAGDNQSIEEPGSAYLNNGRYPVPKPPRKIKKRKVCRVVFDLPYGLISYFLKDSSFFYRLSCLKSGMMASLSSK